MAGELYKDELLHKPYEITVTQEKEEQRSENRYLKEPWAFQTQKSETEEIHSKLDRIQAEKDVLVDKPLEKGKNKEAVVINDAEHMNSRSASLVKDKPPQNARKLVADARSRLTDARTKTGLMPIEVMIPEIGKKINTKMGYGLSIEAWIFDQKKKKKPEHIAFDNYFNFDGFYQEVKSILLMSGQAVVDGPAFRNQIRGRLAEAAGYPSVAVATRIITEKYARTVCEKLYAEPEVWESEEEKLGYLELLKSLGLPFDKEKRQPDEMTIARMMRTAIPGEKAADPDQQGRSERPQ